MDKRRYLVVGEGEVEVSDVRIKPLNWICEDEAEFSAESPFGTYRAYLDAAYDWLVLRDDHDDAWAKYPSDEIGFESAEVAKLACTADYESRVRECLE